MLLKTKKERKAILTNSGSNLMKKLHTILIISLALMLLSNAVFAGVLSPKAEENMGSAFESSFIGGIVIAGTFGAGAAGLALVNTAMVLGISLGVNNLSSTTETDSNLKIVKEEINKEAANYQMNGEIGLVLGAGIKTLKNENPDLSDAEAIDTLVEAIN